MCILYFWIIQFHNFLIFFTGIDNNHIPTGDQQIMVFCTEKSAAVYSLPSQRQMYTQTINESTFVVSFRFRRNTNFSVKSHKTFLRLKNLCAV